MDDLQLRHELNGLRALIDVERMRAELAEGDVRLFAQQVSQQATNTAEAVLRGHAQRLTALEMTERARKAGEAERTRQRRAEGAWRHLWRLDVEQRAMTCQRAVPLGAGLGLGPVAADGRTVPCGYRVPLHDRMTFLTLSGALQDHSEEGHDETGAILRR